MTNKKRIFDMVRSFLDRGFTPGEVDLLDRAIDDALMEPTASPLAERPLGALSERFESGGHGADTVSGGKGDPGGVSYGIWQLSSQAGTAASFVAAEGARWHADFAGARPGSAMFGAAWRRIAEREGPAFAQAQHRFIDRTHYRPAIAAVLKATGCDLDRRHAAVRDATWSTAVQHGAAARILIAAVTQTDAVCGPGDAYDRHLVEAIYAQRSAYVLQVAAHSGGAARRMLESVVRNRYPAERAAALAMFV